MTTRTTTTIITSPDGTRIGCHSTGEGPGVLVVGGALRAAVDYLPLAAALADSFTLHVIDRRGRGSSDPQGSEYSLAKEVEDLVAVQERTSARLAFGHSYGGLVVLETARLTSAFERVAVYEPGVPSGPVPTGWMEPYRRLLAEGAEYGAFAQFVRGSGGAPAFLAKMPQWYLSVALRVGFRGKQWQRMRPLLEPNLVEHQQFAARVGHLADYAAVSVPVLLLCGGRTERTGVAGSFDALRDTIPGATLRIMPGLDHFGPEGKSAAAVAAAVEEFLRSPA